MPHEIINWNDIATDFSESLLIGNGASISIDRCFTYSSLREHALTEGILSTQIQELFDTLDPEDADDFELVLRLVWQANYVNSILGIQDSVTKDVYEHIRDCLIRAVQDIHPDYSQVADQFQSITNFLRGFKTVLSLNYDLILYWVIMYSNNLRDGHKFKDCMIGGKFDDDWRKFRDSYNHLDQRSTLVP